MKQTQLTDLLNTLSNKEIQQLKKWIASPFFNKRKDVVQLFEFYLWYQKKNKEAPSKEQVFEHLFPKQLYDDHKVRLAMSFLKKLVEQFLIYQAEQEQKIRQKLTLAKIYRLRKLDKQAKQQLREVEKLLFDKMKQRGADYYEFSYQYHAEKLEHV